MVRIAPAADMLPSRSLLGVSALLHLALVTAAAVAVGSAWAEQPGPPPTIAIQPSEAAPPPSAAAQAGEPPAVEETDEPFEVAEPPVAPRPFAADPTWRGAAAPTVDRPPLDAVATVRVKPRPSETEPTDESAPEAPEPAPTDETSATPRDTVESAFVPAEAIDERNVAPRYPRVARRRGWEGVVWLLLTIADDGRVEAARVLTSSGHEVLDNAARDAALDWRFAPATRGGVPVPSRRRIPFEFRLRDADD